MNVDAAIIGAGPAGLMAAIELSRNGLSVAVIDEYYLPGGRLLGQHYEDPAEPPGERIWDGKRIAEQLEQQARRQGVYLFTGVTAWSVSKKWEIALSGATENQLFSKVLLLATGSAEKALPIPGWTLPGTISIGAAQTFTNLHRVAVGTKVVIIGIDPLSLSVMLEMRNAGIDVIGMALPPVSPVTGKEYTPVGTLSRLSDAARLAPNAFLRTAGRFALSVSPRLAGHFMRFHFIKIKGVPLYFRKSVVSIDGHDRVEGVTVQPISVDGTPAGQPEQWEADSVCLSAGLYPLVDLIQLTGCPLVEIPELGGMVPLHGNDLSTPVKGLYVAGNITGIEGAKVAMAQGRLAAISIIESLGKKGSMTVNEAMEKVTEARKTSPLRFLPDIEKGRAKLNDLWRKEGIV